MNLGPFVAYFCLATGSNSSTTQLNQSVIDVSATGKALYVFLVVIKQEEK